MEIVLSVQAQKDIEYWKKTKNIKIQERIIMLKNAVISSPYQGIGNPEPLKHHLSGKWSRKIDKVNRFVYSVENNTINIYSHCCPIKNHGTFIFLFILAPNEVLACFSLFLSTVLRIR